MIKVIVMVITVLTILMGVYNAIIWKKGLIIIDNTKILLRFNGNTCVYNVIMWGK